MRVLMIGGTALVGPHVIRELTKEGFAKVWTLTRSGKAYYCERALAGDRDDEALANAIKEARPDLIIDMIPFTVLNAEKLVAACETTGIHPRIVAVSSIDVYSAFGRLNRTEEAPYQPVPISEDMALRKRYGPEGPSYDKIGIERVYQEGFDDLVILRLPAIYGWPDTTRVEFYLDEMLGGAKEITMSEDWAAFRFSRCLHKNAAFAISLAARRRKGGATIYNVAEPTAYTELAWAKKIGALCGWNGEIRLSSWATDVEKPRQQFEVDTHAVRRDLGFFEKYDPDEGLADTIAFHAYSRLGKQYEKYY
ncbi:NAD-dependent epimerase/dehydratase family protein [Alloyangia pacifica]|uniref:NAD-dependent epimerase/dehydratase family protein n=1 Tax=Alloyangia pacifica TaxID=311180 RepID=UPI001CFE5EB3|nr:NAD-dependent epimerase/dehydratase family protein [Alloyangia pacifica]